MLDRDKIKLLLHRRDSIREWLDDEAPYTAADQRHLDANTIERAYWHHGYQSALSDILDLIITAQRCGSGGIPN